MAGEDLETSFCVELGIFLSSLSLAALLCTPVQGCDSALFNEATASSFVL